MSPLSHHRRHNRHETDVAVSNSQTIPFPTLSINIEWAHQPFTDLKRDPWGRMMATLLNIQYHYATSSSCLMLIIPPLSIKSSLLLHSLYLKIYISAFSKLKIVFHSFFPPGKHTLNKMNLLEKQICKTKSENIIFS